MKINVIALTTGYFNFYTFYYFTLFFTLIRSLTKTEKFPLWHWVKKDNFGALKRPYIINQYRTKELPQVPSSFLIVNQYHNFHPKSTITEYDFFLQNLLTPTISSAAYNCFRFWIIQKLSKCLFRRYKISCVEVFERIDRFSPLVHHLVSFFSVLLFYSFWSIFSFFCLIQSKL